MRCYIFTSRMAVLLLAVYFADMSALLFWRYHGAICREPSGHNARLILFFVQTNQVYILD